MDVWCIWMFFLQSYFSGCGGINLVPNPIANAVRNNPHTFNCSVNTDWKSVTFFYDNFNKALFTNQSGTCVNMAVPDSAFPTQCDYNTRTFYLTKLIIDLADQGKVITCRVTYNNGNPASATTTINVQYAPEQPLIVTQTPKGSIIEGNDVVLTCEITGGNPLATISWDCDISSPTPTTSPPPSDTVTSSVTIKVSKNDNGKTCRCTGNHILWTNPKITSHNLIVYYKPLSERPVLSQTPPGSVEESSTVIFGCEIDGGFPLASISWDCFGAAVIEPTTTPPSDKSISRISLLVKEEYNGKVCTCIGSHPAWTTTLNGTLVLSVQFAPEQSPIVKQIPQGPIIEGNSLVLTCEITGGNPLATITWECDGSSPTSTTSPPTSNTVTSSVKITVSKNDNGKTCGCIGNHILWTDPKITSHDIMVYYKPSSERPVLSQTPTGSVNESSTVILVCEIDGGFPLASISWNCLGAAVIEPTVTPPSDKSVSRRSLVVKKEYNSRICTCIGSHPAWPTTLNGTLILSVQFAPEQSPIVKEVPPGPIIEGNSVVLTCDITGGNPLATITWECDGSSPTPTTPPPPSDTVTSSVTIAVSKNDNGKTCRCIGNHMLWTNPKITSHNLIVYYKPSSEGPVLSKTPPGSVNEGSTVTLECEIDGGFPLASISWDCLGVAVIEPTVTPPSDKSVSRRSLVVKKEYNGRICTCFGSHPAWSTTRSGTLILSVQFAPDHSPIVKQIPSGPIIESNSVVLTCNITGGNPLASLTWDCVGSSPTSTTLPRPNDTVTSSVTITVSKNDNEKTCRCIGNHILWTNAEITSHNLIVYYSPVVNIPGESTIEIVEDYKLNLTCDVLDANPAVSIFIWYKDENLVSQGSNAAFILNEADRDDIGNYTCEASNGIGSNGVDMVYVDILYEPAITRLVVQQNNTVNENDTAVLQCDVSSNPPSSVTWTFGKTNIILKNETGVGQSNYTISRITCYETGIYNCTASNIIKHQKYNVTKSVDLFVKCSPRLYNSIDQPENEIGLALGTNLSLEVDLIAYPKPNITWLFTQNSTVEGQQISGNCNRHISLFEHIACVNKLNLTEDDFGEYILKIKNGVGKNLLVPYTVKPQGPPVKSSNVNASCGNLFVDVTWKAEYNGGLAQRFYILVTGKNGDISIYNTNILGRRKEKKQTYRLSSIPPGFYTFQILGNHSFGNASSDPSSCLVKDIPPQEENMIGLAAGLGACFAVIIVVVVIVVVFIRRRISKSKGNSSTDQGRINLTASDEDGDGLKDNILYESAGANYTPQGQIGGAEYAVVNKKDKHALQNHGNGTKETAIYSVVDKKGKNAGNDGVVSKGKVNRKAKGKTQNKEVFGNKKNEDVYENVTKQYDQNKEKKNLNKDGLSYADLVFEPSPNGGKFVIIGLENRTIYAEVDTTQKIDPLPDTDSDGSASDDLKNGKEKN